MQRDLVLRAQTGDHDAYNALALAAVDRLHRTAHLILRDQERASDAVQDALIAAWRDIRAVRDPDRLNAWLHRLLVNACFRAANRDRRRSVVDVHVAEIDAPMPRSDHDDFLVRDELERAFRRLTTEQRAVLVLDDYLGLPDAAAPRRSVFQSGRSSPGSTGRRPRFDPRSKPNRGSRAGPRSRSHDRPVRSRSRTGSVDGG